MGLIKCAQAIFICQVLPSKHLTENPCYFSASFLMEHRILIANVPIHNCRVLSAQSLGILAVLGVEETAGEMLGWSGEGEWLLHRAGWTRVTASLIHRPPATPSFLLSRKQQQEGMCLPLCRWSSKAEQGALTMHSSECPVPVPCSTGAQHPSAAGLA